MLQELAAFLLFSVFEISRRFRLWSEGFEIVAELAIL